MARDLSICISIWLPQKFVTTVRLVTSKLDKTQPSMLICLAFARRHSSVQALTRPISASGTRPAPLPRFYFTSSTPLRASQSSLHSSSSKPRSFTTGVPNRMKATADQIKQLGEFSTCELGDCLLKLKVPHGGYIPELECYTKPVGDKWASGAIVGEAYNVKMVDCALDKGDESDPPKLQGGHFVDQAFADSVMVISSPGPHIQSASFGGLLGLAASKRKVKAVIIDGRCRDLEELNDVANSTEESNKERQAMKVWAKGHSCLGQSPFTRPSQVNLPITIVPWSSGGPGTTPFPKVIIEPGDLIAADRDGVVVIKNEQEWVEKVITLTRKGKAIDERCKEDLAKGESVSATFKLHRGK